MPPILALGLFVAGVVWLLAMEKKWRWEVSKAIWIPFFWLIIIGSRPISLWFGLGEPTGVDYLEGSPLDRLFFLSLIVMGGMVLMTRRVNWPEIFARNKWILIYFLYLGLSTMWSVEPFVAFKRWIKDVGNVVLVLVVLTEKNPIDAAKALMLRCSYLLIPGSVLVIKYYPALGRYYDRWTYKPFFGGVATDKNSLGITLFVCGLALFWTLFDLRNARSQGKDKMEKATLVGLILMTVWLLRKANSSTALACTVVGASILIAMRYPTIRAKAQRMGVYGAAGVIVLLFFEMTFGLSEMIIKLLGRDLTLTGRTDIWKAVLAERINPVLGAGFYSFWLGDRPERLSEKFYYHLNQAHNGYLETYLNSGWIGIFLLAAVLVSAARRIQDRVAAGSSDDSLRLAFLVSSAVYNITEAAFDRLNLLWFFLLLVIFEIGKPRRTRSHTVKTRDKSVEPLPDRVAVTGELGATPRGASFVLLPILRRVGVLKYP